MGGPGSGRIGGRRGATCDEYLAIDLAVIRAKSGLRSGWNGRLTWSRNETVTGVVDYRIEPDGLRLLYRSRGLGADWRDIDELVPFASTATQFGGSRRWLVCLSCRRRCRILYGGARFRCRRCYRLRYESQYERGFQRATTKAQRVRRTLGGDICLDEPFPPKPKGMHWKTYHRLEEQDEALQERWATGVMAWMRKME